MDWRKFVAVGNSGTIYTSSNGEDWYAFDRKILLKIVNRHKIIGLIILEYREMEIIL